MAELIGEPPVGWFCGRPSVNTRRLLVEQGGYLYDRDYHGDELRFWVEVGGAATSSSPTLARNERQPVRPEPRIQPPRTTLPVT